MPKPDKVAAVKEIAEALQATDVYYFVDYRGLTFAEATDLRARLAKSGAREGLVVFAESQTRGRGRRGRGRRLRRGGRRRRGRPARCGAE